MFAPHYSVASIKTMAEVRTFFPDGEASELNWLFCATSGVHGTYLTIDECEREIRDPAAYELENNEPPSSPTTITVLIVQPRIVHMRYGEVSVTLDDLAWLRRVVTSSVEWVAKSQAGNLLAD